VQDQQTRASNQLSVLSALVGKEGLEKTEPKYTDVTFGRVLKLEIRGVQMEVHHRGPAHTPGDSFVWLPQSRVFFAGDIVYSEQLPTLAT
jgi:glyoxylase-like metal-dependent hydrolase (beta-lactamase superfamily II)